MPRRPGRQDPAPAPHGRTVPLALEIEGRYRCSNILSLEGGVGLSFRAPVSLCSRREQIETARSTARRSDDPEAGGAALDDPALPRSLPLPLRRSRRVLLRHAAGATAEQGEREERGQCFGVRHANLRSTPDISMGRCRCPGADGSSYRRTRACGTDLSVELTGIATGEPPEWAPNLSEVRLHGTPGTATPVRGRRRHHAVRGGQGAQGSVPSRPSKNKPAETAETRRLHGRV
jgi:hypothetical protein